MKKLLQEHINEIKELFGLCGYKNSTVETFVEFCHRMIAQESISIRAKDMRNLLSRRIHDRRHEFFLMGYPDKPEPTVTVGSCTYTMNPKYEEILIKLLLLDVQKEEWMKDKIKILKADGKTLTSTNLNICGITNIAEEHALHILGDLSEVYRGKMPLDGFNEKWNTALGMERIKRLIVGIRVLLEDFTEGHVHYEYRQHHVHGRLHVEEPGLNFQNCPSEVRKVFFKGIGWEYDMIAAHYALMQQKMIVDMGHAALDRDFPTITQYIRDRSAFRTALAAETDLPIALVKEVLTSIAYGAKIQSAHPEDGTFMTVVKHLEKLHPDLDRKEQWEMAKEPFNRLKGNMTVQSMLRESKVMTTTIIEHYKAQSGAADYIVNDLGQRFELTYKRKDKVHRKSPAQILANICQTLETKVLLKIVEKYGDRIMLLQHDGFTTNTRLDLEELQQYINSEFGYDLHYSEEQL